MGEHMNDRLASAAFRYALRRIAVFPLSPGSKIPIKGSHGLHDASVDSDVARIRWKKHPGANIAAATGARSGFWVVDIDPGGDKSLARLEFEHGPLPLTVEASTPRGGKHLYWKWPTSGPEIRSSTGRLGPGLDVRGEGGSIVLPPSVLADGRRYAWGRNGVREIAEPPPWLVDLTLPPARPARREPSPLTGDISRYCASAIAGELVSLAEAKPGQRNDALNHAAFKIGNFVGAGAVPREWAESELIRCGCGLGLSERAVLATVASGLSAGEKKPRELPR